MAEVLTITEEEQKVIHDAFNSLLKSMDKSLLNDDKENLQKAFELANDAHKHQRRKSGEPYILHPIEVGRICYQEIGLGPTAVISAILHDVVEDTPVTQEEIVATFGTKIGKIVDGLTKIDGLYNKDTGEGIESPQAENFKKVLSTLVEDVRVVLIKMADRLHNLRTIGSMPQHKQLKISAETSYIFVPLAHRLGLYQIKTEFQDICMKISDSETYNDIKTKLNESEDNRQEYVQEFLKPIEKKLVDTNISFRTLGRSKAIHSIYNKIKTKQVPFEEIYDLFAVRIIVDVPIEDEKSVCWQVYSMITDVYRPIPERLKDWVTSPKGNGYESLHTTVIGPEGRYVEVQIRSERMDEIAERGFAAHWKYKGVKGDHSVYDTWLENVRDILDTQHADALEFMTDFKTNLFNEEVYVFTPNGDMKILPKGATALDFAFEIHTDIGYHAVAIKVNNKLVPMGQKLENGDQVSVTTNKNQKPNEEWLKMVVTGKARSKVRSSMKEEKRKQGELAKERIDRKLKNMKLLSEENIDFLVKHYGYKNRPDFYIAVASGKVKVIDFKHIPSENNKFIVKKVAKEENAAELLQHKEAKRAKKTVKNKSNILVNGEPVDQYKFELASCCNPVQGDNIFAYTNSMNELKIHRQNCSNATHLLANYGYRVLKAEWANIVSNNFVVDLMITGVDSGIGVIQSLTNEISTKLGVNIRSFSIDGHEGFFKGQISIVVINKDQLNLVIKSIERLDGVSTVTRKDKFDIHE
ncbi:MAG: RelA/SpoT family protein [Saprospiraceae bacterium]|nr:RelA/SpoT family protein [Saprospiraceae bacterium]